MAAVPGQTWTLPGCGPCPGHDWDSISLVVYVAVYIQPVHTGLLSVAGCRGAPYALQCRCCELQLQAPESGACWHHVVWRHVQLLPWCVVTHGQVFAYHGTLLPM